MEADNQVAAKPAGAIKLKCLWKECGKEFDPMQRHQRFCRPECRHAYNNYRKISGIHLAPRVQAQLQDLADGQGIPIDEMANVMLARVLNPDGRPLDDTEIYGKEP